MLRKAGHLLRTSLAAPGAGPATSRGLRQFAAGSASTDESRQVYMVFGATGAIGSALCKQLLSSPSGSSTVIAAGRSSEKLQQLAQQHDGLHTVAVDVLDSQAVAQVVDQVYEQHGRLSGVANCVGNLLSKSALTTSDEELHDTISVNLVSCFNILRPSVRAMTKSHGGSIALVSAAVARYGLPNYDAFAAAKGGVIGLTLGAASSYSRSGVRVNCVAPGLIADGLTSRIMDNKGARELTEEMHALKRVGTPQDIAVALAYLLGPSSQFVTGQIVGVDGGLASVRPADLAA